MLRLYNTKKIEVTGREKGSPAESPLRSTYLSKHIGVTKWFITKPSYKVENLMFFKLGGTAENNFVPASNMQWDVFCVYYYS